MNSPFPYRLAVFDMDDTLLGPDKKISPENRDALARLRAAKVEVVIASGRFRANVAIFEESLGFLGWIISAGGAVVSNGATGEIVHEMTVPQELGLELFHRGREAGISIIGYHSTGIFCDAQTEWTALYLRRTGQVPIADIPALIDTGLQKLIWTTSAARIAELSPHMQEEYRGRLYVVNTEHEMLEFLNPQVNKALAVQVLARRLDIPREQIIAFGDGNNDVPLLEWAGMSVAMAHGRESARRAGKKISPPGDPGTAVARSLEAFFPMARN
jgi:Cof subfamily protein (haloacid dehalogenase superfamily)